MLILQQRKHEVEFMLYLDLYAVQLRVTLADLEPLVWRRLVVPLTWHLGQLHLVIQAAFNWWNDHLHEFSIGGLRYGDLESGDGGDFPENPRFSMSVRFAYSTSAARSGCRSRPL